jgi:hypothetical protein
MTAQLDEHGGRILLGDNTGGRAVMLRPIRFQCVGVWMSVCLPCTYVYSWQYVYSFSTCAKFELAPDLPESNYCLSRRVSVTVGGENCLMRFFLIYVILFGWSNQVGWNGRDVWHTWKRREMFTGFSVGKHEGKRRLVRPRLRWADDFKVGLK